MPSEIDIKKEITRRLDRLNAENLIKLWKYMTRMKPAKNHISETLSFAGSWNDLDDDTFQELTANLFTRRKQTRDRRVNE